ncbi:MAG: Bug family tripartite tricarboxylate transporter substrate binding protein [Lautropia sp.]
MKRSFPNPGRRWWSRAALAVPAGIAAGASPFASRPAHAQADWPSRPVKVVSPFPPGGLADSTARLFSEQLARRLGQPFVVENRPGASATIGTEAVARAPADGQTLLMSFSANITITPHVEPVRYDPLKDLVPVAKLTGYTGLVAVHRDAPFKDYRDLVAAAKREPGRLSYASNGVGTTSFLIANILHQQAGIELNHVPYKGSAEFLTDLLAQRIDVIYDSIALPQIKAGRLKSLAVLTPTRDPQLPDVPTIAELGFQMPNRNWFAVFVPQATPPAVIERLAGALQASVEDPAVKERLTTLSQYPEYLGTAAFAERVRDDSRFFAEFVERHGLRSGR